MKTLFAMTFAMAIFCAADWAWSEPFLSFRTYAFGLVRSDSVIFVSDCEMANGNRGIIVFKQDDRGGRYFELKGDQTVRYEEVILSDGGFEIKTASGMRYIGNGDGAIMTLIRSYPFFMVPSHNIDSVLRSMPKGKCFENEQ